MTKTLQLVLKDRHIQLDCLKLDLTINYNNKKK